MENANTRPTSSSISRSWACNRKNRYTFTCAVTLGIIVLVLRHTVGSQVWVKVWHTESNSQNEGNTLRDAPDVVENVARNHTTLPKMPVYPEKELADMIEAIRSSESYMRAPSEKARQGYKGNDSDKDNSEHTEQGTFVDKALGQMENGFFVECGAADGVIGSNTLMLERKRKWTGLLVEANVNFYKKLLTADRNAYSANVCLSPTTHSEVLTFRPALGYGGLAESMSPKQLVVVKTKRGGKDEDQVLTQCFPLYALLCALNRTKVDYFSLDIEGAELDVLRTIPFDKIHIEVFSVEYRIPEYNRAKIDIESSAARLQKIREFFRALNLYREIGILPPVDSSNEAAGLDVIFKHV